MNIHSIYTKIWHALLPNKHIISLVSTVIQIDTKHHKHIRAGKQNINVHTTLTYSVIPHIPKHNSGMLFDLHTKYHTPSHTRLVLACWSLHLAPITPDTATSYSLLYCLQMW